MFRSKINLCILIAVLLTMAIGGSIIVSSQNNQNRAQISSPTGLKQKPENLRVPQNNRNQPNQVNKYLPQEIPDDVTFRQIFKNIEDLNKKLMMKNVERKRRQEISQSLQADGKT